MQSFESGRSSETEQEISHVRKGYLPGWTEEVFTIRDERPGTPVTTYMAHEMDDTLVRGTFCEEGVKKMMLLDDDFFRVDTIVKRKGDKVLVHWRGWPDKYDSLRRLCMRKL